MSGTGGMPNVPPFPPEYRASGILLHVTSLPSPYGIADLGPSAFLWINRLQEAGQKWWQALPVVLKGTKDGFSAETSLGEKYYGKFDDRFYLTEDDPGNTMASVKLLNPNTVELTEKREGKISGILRLTVAPDGKSIHGMFVRKPDNAVNTFEMEKQQP